MKIKEEQQPAFLTGGGHMGALIRSYDWSTTALGCPHTWPLSLRFAVRMMLDNPFGMYIAWGTEYIQLYNDGYRPILGSTKHPQALGLSTRHTFAEIWPTIGPMFKGAMQGTAVGFPNLVLHLNRNGFLEECVFDFSYSPIRLEDGAVGGVLVTVIETTEKVKAARALKESEEQLQFAIEATELGTWDLDLSNNKFKCNSRLKEWFGLEPDEKIDLSIGLASIAEYDRGRVSTAIESVIQFSLGGQYDIIYTIIHPQTKKVRIVRAKGRASFNDNGIAYRLNGTLQDVTEDGAARRLLTESTSKFRTLSESIPHLVWTSTAEGKRDYFNKYFIDYTGLSFEKLSGDGWQAIIFPDDLTIELEHWNHTLKTGEDFRFEKRIRRHDGTYCWHLCHGIAQKDMQGKIIGWIGTNTEIEEQKKITEVLAQGEEQFRTFANSIQNLAWIANGEGWIYWYNQRWYDYTGTSFEEMEGWGWQKVHHPDHVEKIVALSKQLWEKDEAFELTFPLRRHDGEYRWFLTRAYPVKDASGKIGRWIGTNTDITEQKDFTEELKTKVKERTAELEERKNFVETILDTSNEYIAVYATDFTLIQVNTAVENMMGKKREDLVGKKLLELFPHAKGTKSEADLQSAFNGNIVHNEPYQSSVTGRYIENYITPLKDKQGNIYAALAIATDVTNIALKQMEIEVVNEQLQLQNQTFELAEKIAKLGSYKWNLSTGSLEYSDNLFRLFDCEPQKLKPSVKNFLSFVHPNDLQLVIKALKKRMQTSTLVEISYRIVSNKGIIKHLRSSASLTVDVDNRIIIGTVQDISKDIAAAEELRTKNLELESINAELASFSYVASHDLKEPLRKIQTFSRRIIELENFSDKTQDYFNRIISAAERMQNLIDSLLSFSVANKTGLIVEPCDLNAIVEESKIDLQTSINEKQVVIEYENLPTINGVFIQISQLITNLLDNAIKYSRPENSPHIKIIAYISEGKDIMHVAANRQIAYHVITIADNGIGFENEYADKIFELFQRLHGKSEYPGTGIGLAIVKKIVTNHNGFIIAEGNLNKGAKFIIYIPAT